MTIKYKTTGRTFKTYTQDSDGFHFSPDGISLMPRAAFHINSSCPESYKHIILECINKGWLTRVAHQPIHEAFIEIVSN
jgi:hypothetical protein